MSLAKILALDKPLVLIDLETTSLQRSTARIVQIGVIKIYPDGTETKWDALVNPSEIDHWHIPEEATGVHGISDDDVKDEQSFLYFGPLLHRGMGGCFVGGYNVHFDMDVLDFNFARIKIPFEPEDYMIVDAFDIFKHFHPRGLKAAYEHYCGKDMENAHDAAVDIQVTKEVLESQLQSYWEFPKTIPEIHNLLTKSMVDKIDRTGKFIWKDDGPCINFGTHEGKRMDHVPKGYYTWMANQEDFIPKVRRIAAQAALGVFPEKINELPKV